eukprot:CAMPEP_0196778034 /NCGR_PEP_ID=MMETSP1104-20130614/5563_1 /TAXON_ID=33652 /ORGANISM="Cafeteria sp., Strain Caron Lab Isolate" /LENGTH=93 /DNA_ID=CAMNT_0042148201 /DNA_START=176 /DNA_END=453 /DNA_ORIENTATION=-
MDAMRTGVQRKLEGEGLDPGSFELTTDDLLSLLLHAVARADEGWPTLLLPLHVEFVEEFALHRPSASRHSFNHANMQVAVEWLVEKAGQKEWR